MTIIFQQKSSKKCLELFKSKKEIRMTYKLQIFQNMILINIKLIILLLKQRKKS